MLSREMGGVCRQLLLAQLLAQLPELLGGGAKLN